jgi:hypothetical protein
MLMQLAMVGTADGNRELVANLKAEAPRLRKTKMMGISGRAATDETGLAGYVFAVILVAQANCLWRHAATAWGHL